MPVKYLRFLTLLLLKLLLYNFWCFFVAAAAAAGEEVAAGKVCTAATAFVVLVGHTAPARNRSIGIRSMRHNAAAIHTLS